MSSSGSETPSKPKQSAVTRTLRERREGVLQRTGVAEKNRRATEAPTATFYVLLVTVMFLVILGLIMVLSSSSVTSLHTGGSAWSLFLRQLLWAFFGTGAMWATYTFPYTMWRSKQWLYSVIIGSVGLNVVVALKGQIVNGAKAWLQLGPIRIQPSEFLKIAVVLYCADLLAKRHRYVAVKQKVWYPLLFALALSAGLCKLQSDYGSALIFIFIVLALMFIASVPRDQMFLTLGGIAVIGIGVLNTSTNAKRRYEAWRNLELNKGQWGYQVYQALLSIANGGAGGTGIGSGTSKWGYVPLAYSDFIFAVVAEELGTLGAFLVIGAYVVLVVFGLRTALRARDMYGAFLAGGISAWIGMQAFVNIGGVTNAIPMTGLTLPFMSYGGSSLLATMAAAGLLLNVARTMK